MFTAKDRDSEEEMDESLWWGTYVFTKSASFVDGTTCLVLCLWTGITGVLIEDIGIWFEVIGEEGEEIRCSAVVDIEAEAGEGLFGGEETLGIEEVEELCRGEEIEEEVLLVIGLNGSDKTSSCSVWKETRLVWCKFVRDDGVW